MVQPAAVQLASHAVGKPAAERAAAAGAASVQRPTGGLQQPGAPARCAAQVPLQRLVRLGWPLREEHARCPDRCPQMVGLQATHVLSVHPAASWHKAL